MKKKLLATLATSLLLSLSYSANANASESQESADTNSSGFWHYLIAVQDYPAAGPSEVQSILTAISSTPPEATEKNR